ncbi:acyl carrier protein [Spiroplasma endosymbiont of Labia minor]|uniref:acyl carrier protein n=1 Tax=Spiroplasma endosymbiont of Labia minor TaxID=3066305 RepID=UPI0030CDAC03
MEEIKKVLKQKGAKGEITNSTLFDSLGLDSLDIMDMVVTLEEKTGVTFSDETLLEIKSVEDLIRELTILVEKK